MRLFVSEYVCGGAWNDGPLDNSLADEGRSMLLAACADFSRIPNVQVVTTWDSRLGPFPLSAVEAVRTDPSRELQEFDRLIGECDAAFVIAPEFDQILT
ncbi:MAG: ATP-dependent carboxylate-amine ligase, partial [Planctomycetaceae bacterium]